MISMMRRSSTVKITHIRYGWRTAIRYILTNEKYIGDSLVQKFLYARDSPIGESKK